MNDQTEEGQMTKLFSRFLAIATVGVAVVAIGACAAGGGTAATAGPAAQQETIELIAQSVFPKGMPLTDSTLSLWADKVAEMSGGRLIINVHGAGEIVGGPEVLDAVRDGVIDLGMNTPAWQKGEFPAGDLFYTLPGGITEFHDLVLWMYAGEGAQLLQEMYGDTLVAFPLGVTPPEQFWTNRPIRRIEDFRGLRMRNAGLSMDLFERLGASVVLLGGGEVVPAMQRGVIDAAEFHTPSMDMALGLQDVARYVHNPPIHMGSNMFTLIINPGVWNRLPADLQAIMREAAMSATFHGYMIEWANTMTAFERQVNHPNLTHIKLSPELQAQIRDIAFDMINDLAQQDAFFNRVWQSQVDFLRRYRPFHEFASFDLGFAELD